MHLYIVLLICCVLLSSARHAEGYNCKQNIPDALQNVLVKEINSKRQQYKELGPNTVAYDCGLAEEAFTGRFQYGKRDHFTIEGVFDSNWEKTLHDAIANVHASQIVTTTTKATQVGCGVRLTTLDENDGVHKFTMECDFDTRNGLAPR